MNYVKKMCILRQIKQGFSGDGKTLSGLIKIEQYGKNLAVEVSIINFAPLVSGEYYCLLSDGKGKTEMLALRGKSMFNILSEIDVSTGFCGIICYVKTEVVPIAYGINGNGSYDWRAILQKVMPPVFPASKTREASVSMHGETASSALFTEENEPTVYEINENFQADVVGENKREKEAIPLISQTDTADYDDEKVATENYFEEGNRERIQPTETVQNADTQNANQTKGEEIGADAATNEHATRLLHASKTAPDGYYLSVKRELDGLFERYPKDDALCAAFTSSRWARLRGSAENPQYLVGALYEDGRVKYLCYALAAEDKNAPPEEIKNVCTFVPISPFVDAQGFFVLFQSAATGECIKPTRA